MKKEATLADIHDEVSKANRLTILMLVRLGVRQGDIATALRISTGGLSGMFPKGVLRAVANQKPPDESEA